MTPWAAARQTPLSSTISQSLLRFMSIELVMLSSHLILCYPHLLLPSIFTSIKVFSSESALCIRWPKYWSFRFSISPSNVDFLFKSLFRTDWLDLLVVQGTLKSFLQHCNWKASILQCSAFFMVIEFCLKAPIKNHLTGKLYLSPWEEVLSGNQLPRRKSSTVQ